MKQPSGGQLPPRSFLGNLGDSTTAGVKAYGRWAAALPSRWARAFAFIGPAIIVVLALSAVGEAIGSGGSPAQSPAVVLLAPSIAPAGAPAAGVTVEPTRSLTPLVIQASSTPPPAARPTETPLPVPVTATVAALVAPPTQGVAAAVAPLVATQPNVAPNAASAPIATPRPPTVIPAPPTSTPKPPPAAPTTAPAPAQSGNCSPAYPTVCIPPPPPDLNCKDVPYKRFKVLPPDPHGFDSDHDGIGCES